MLADPKVTDGVGADKIPDKSSQIRRTKKANASHRQNHQTRRPGVLEAADRQVPLAVGNNLLATVVT